MGSQYFAGAFENLTSQSCVVDTSLPTFGGVTGLTANTDGSITATWTPGTTTKPVIHYEVYILPGTVSAATLFNDANVTKIVLGSGSTRVFTLADQSTYLINGTTYTLGVKAIDALGYEGGPASVMTVTAIASGNLPAVYQTIASNLAATETLLSADQVAFAADVASLTTQVGLLTTQVSSVTLSAASLSSSASSIAAQVLLMTAQVLQLTTDVSQFDADLVTLAANLTTLSGYLSSLNSENIALAASIVALNAAIAALGVITNASEIIGGKSAVLKTPHFVATLSDI